jgi:hypothetical protein
MAMNLQNFGGSEVERARVSTQHPAMVSGWKPFDVAAIRIEWR